MWHLQLAFLKPSLAVASAKLWGGFVPLRPYASPPSWLWRHLSSSSVNEFHLVWPFVFLQKICKTLIAKEEKKFLFRINQNVDFYSKIFFIFMFQELNLVLISGCAHINSVISGYRMLSPLQQLLLAWVLKRMLKGKKTCLYHI